MLLKFALACVLIFCQRCYARMGIPTLRTVQVDDKAFYIPEESLVSFPEAQVSSVEVLPMTFITFNTTEITRDAITRILRKWETMDDVYSQDFLQGRYPFFLVY